MNVARQLKQVLTPEELDKKFGWTLPSLAEEELKLPIGMTVDDTLVRTATVRAMRGKDRKNATTNKARRSASHMTTALLVNCVETLGGKKPTIQQIRELPEPDRAYLAMEVRRRSIPGEPIMVTGECTNPSCMGKFDFFIDIEKIEIRYVDNPLWREGRPCFLVDDEKMNIHAVLHHLNGNDMESLSLKYSNQPERKVNPVELLEDMLKKMVIEINGQEVTEEDYDAFPALVTSVLEAGIIENRGGPDLEQHAHCPDCGKPVDVQVNIVDFLLRAHQKKD